MDNSVCNEELYVNSLRQELILQWMHRAYRYRICKRVCKGF